MAKPLFLSSHPSSSISGLSENSAKTTNILGFRLISLEIEKIHPVRFIDSSVKVSSRCRNHQPFTLKASKESMEVNQEVICKSTRIAEQASNHFVDLRQGFDRFKKNAYLQHLNRYQRLAECQEPKFMVIACADSRVCPSNILGFQPGEAFVVRNVANLVPPHENGPSETNAALEFAVNALEVKNILVIGHSCCGGIRALMSHSDEVDSHPSFIKSWVGVGRPAKLATTSASSNLDFAQQCRHCEKESINRSLLNLLTYPWVKDRVMKGSLSIHGGYYDFIDCTFEKWTLDCHDSSTTLGNGCSIVDREFWT